MKKHNLVKKGENNICGGRNLLAGVCVPLEVGSDEAS